MPLPSPHALPDCDLAGKVVLVTGATGGLGRALTLAVAARGATVVLHATVVRKLEALYDEILAGGGPEPTILPLDFARAAPADFANVAGALQAQCGRLDALVHTAATLGSLGPVEHQPVDGWETSMRVNLHAPFALTRALLPMLRVGPDAAIIFTLDTRSLEPKAFWGAYGIAKAGLAALTRTLADELENESRVRVNGVIPGPMRSPLRAQSHPGDNVTRLTRPEAFVPLYLHLVRGQSKAESGGVIDAARWLAGLDQSA